MKRFIVLAVVSLSLVVAGSAFAADRYGAAGCGLGSLLLGDQQGIVQIFASTTNGTFGNQTFGITSGTSNCGKSISFAGNERLNEFVRANMDNLAKDIAVGHGESLETLAELLEIAPAQRSAVSAKLKENFAVIFPSEKVQTSEVIDSIARVIYS